ncbi:hypothetical protein [Jatrophihabitans sp.]|nr:hypothetical protein [Jatrophihabitans sp.]
MSDELTGKRIAFLVTNSGVEPIVAICHDACDAALVDTFATA